jgi:hypothetical protein
MQARDQSQVSVNTSEPRPAIGKKEDTEINLDEKVEQEVVTRECKDQAKKPLLEQANDQSCLGDEKTKKEAVDILRRQLILLDLIVNSHKIKAKGLSELEKVKNVKNCTLPTSIA